MHAPVASLIVNTCFTRVSKNSLLNEVSNLHVHVIQSNVKESRISINCYLYGLG